MMRCVFPVLAWALLIATPAAQGGESATKPLSLDLLRAGAEAEDGPTWFDFLGDNARLAIDVSARPFYNTRTDEWYSAHFLGIDLHKVFSNSSGDWGTLILQPYLTRLDSPMHPPFFEDSHDLELVWRIANLNYTGLAAGKLSFKVGHLELPFGLEHDVNTNGTLRDYMHGRNLGVKADWGGSINGVLDTFRYEVALTRGTGNEWSSRGDPHLLSGRIATVREGAVVVGVSGLHGEVQKTALPGNTLRRTRIGVDASWELPLVTLRAELSGGRDGNDDVINGVAEIDWSNPDETILVYDQVQFFNTDGASGPQDAVKNHLGVRWTPDRHWALSVQWVQDLTVMLGNTAGVYQFQLRFRF